MNLTCKIPVEHGEVLVRSTDNYIFALDYNQVMGASKCIPFDYSCSLIPGVADLGYNSTTLSWIFKFIRCELIQDIETLPFNELRCIACAASDWNLYCLQNLCRLALRCVSSMFVIDKANSIITH